jgi:hypothetical protein
MADKQLTDMRVAIVVSDDFGQVEMTEPKRELEVELFAESKSRVAH